MMTCQGLLEQEETENTEILYSVSAVTSCSNLGAAAPGNLKCKCYF